MENDAPHRVYKKYVITYTVTGEDFGGGLDDFIYQADDVGSLGPIEQEEQAGTLYGYVLVSMARTLTAEEAAEETNGYFGPEAWEEEGDD